MVFKLLDNFFERITNWAYPLIEKIADFVAPIIAVPLLIIFRNWFLRIPFGIILILVGVFLIKNYKTSMTGQEAHHPNRWITKTYVDYLSFILGVILIVGGIATFLNRNVG